MNQTTQTWTGIAVLLLGVTAAGAALFGIAVPLIVLNLQRLDGPAGAAVVAIGAVSLLFALAAAFASLAVAAQRRRGTVVGLVIGAVVVLSAGVASASGGWHPALAGAFALGGGIVGSLLFAGAVRPYGAGAA
ncbi:MAG TPA: hypothetical protein VF365_03390 [Candidatus Limnocylindria bacterium]